MSVRKGLPCLMHVYSLLRNYTSSLGTELPVHPSGTLLFTASLACLSPSLVRIAHVTSPLARSPHPGADRLSPEGRGLPHRNTRNRLLLRVLDNRRDSTSSRRSERPHLHLPHLDPHTIPPRSRGSSYSSEGRSSPPRIRRCSPRRPSRHDQPDRRPCRDNSPHRNRLCLRL